jgi:hypothetical protein
MPDKQRTMSTPLGAYAFDPYALDMALILPKILGLGQDLGRATETDNESPDPAVTAFLHPTCSPRRYVHNTAPGFSRLLNLPAELREKVYPYYLESIPQHKHPRNVVRRLYFMSRRRTRTHDWSTLLINEYTCKVNQPSTVPHFLPYLAITDRFVRAEVVRVMLRRADSLVIVDSEVALHFLRFLESFDEDWHSIFCIPCMSTCAHHPANNCTYLTPRQVVTPHLAVTSWRS